MKTKHPDNDLDPILISPIRNTKPIPPCSKCHVRDLWGYIQRDAYGRCPSCQPENRKCVSCKNRYKESEMSIWDNRYCSRCQIHSMGEIEFVNGPAKICVVKNSTERKSS